MLLGLLLVGYESVQAQSKVDSLKRELSSAEGKEQIDLLNMLAWELKFNDPALSLEYIDKAIKASEKRNYEHGLMLANKNLVGVHFVKGKPDSTLIYARKALEYIDDQEKRDNKYQLGKIHNLIAVSYRKQKDFRNSLAHQDTALNIFRELNDSSEIVGNLHNKATLYQTVNDNVAAFRLYKKVLEYELSKGSDYGIARTAIPMGIIAQQNGDYFNARKYYRMAIKYSKKIGNKRWYASTLHDLANVFSEQDSTQKAIAYYKKALKINRESGFRGYQANNFRALGIEYSKYDTQKAISYYQKAARIYKPNFLL